MIIYLVRHAESAPSSALPEPEWPLSEKGISQAIELCEVLDKLDIEGLFSSPYPRAIDTVRPFAEKMGLDIELVESFRERKLTEGMVQDFLSVLERAWLDFDFKMPNCESSRECKDRFGLAIREVVKNSDNGTIAISSHGNAIGLFLNSMDSNFGFANWKEIRNPDIFKVRFEDNVFNWDKEFSW